MALNLNSEKALFRKWKLIFVRWLSYRLVFATAIAVLFETSCRWVGKPGDYPTGQLLYLYLIAHFLSPFDSGFL